MYVLDRCGGLLGEEGGQAVKSKQEIMEALLIHSTDGDCMQCPYAGERNCTKRLTEDVLKSIETEKE